MRPVGTGEQGARSATIHQVAGGQRPLREVRHPLAPELLVAELAGELPPDVALAVREHVASCESCSDRARALAHSYELLGSLGQEPVDYVPDLRHSVRQRLSREQLLPGLMRAARSLGRGGLVGAVALCAVAVLAVLIPLLGTVQGPSLLVTRSSNGLTKVPAAGASGVLYAQTSKIVDVQDAAGQTWPAAEVIAVDQRTGRVVRSLPAAGSLRIGQVSELPVALALSPDGQTIFELTPVVSGHQALLAIDASTGALRFATPLTLPGGAALPSRVWGVTLAIGPAGGQAFVGLSLGAAGLSGPRVLVLDHGGAQVVAALSPAMPASVPLPPTTPSLPDVVTPTPTSYFATTGLAPSLTMSDGPSVSPDGRWLYDAVTFTDALGQQTLVVRRIAVADGTTEQALAIPGAFTISAMHGSPSAAHPLLYVAQAGVDGQLYILDASAAGPSLMAAVPLGGPLAPEGTVFAGQVTVSPSASGSRVYVSADVSSADQQFQSHDIWLVDSTSATIAAHRVAYETVGQVQANTSGGASGHVFLLSGTQVVLLPPDLAIAGAPPTWLSLQDGRPVLRLVGTGG